MNKNVTLITGGSRGIGRATAQALAARGEARRSASFIVRARRARRRLLKPFVNLAARRWRFRPISPAKSRLSRCSGGSMRSLVPSQV